jgi:hypothetical protein
MKLNANAVFVMPTKLIQLNALGFLAIEHYNIVTTLTPSAWVVMGTSFCLILLIRRIPKKKPRGRKRTFQPYA